MWSILSAITWLFLFSFLFISMLFGLLSFVPSQTEHHPFFAEQDYFTCGSWIQIQSASSSTCNADELLSTVSDANSLSITDTNRWIYIKAVVSEPKRFPWQLKGFWMCLLHPLVFVHYKCMIYSASHWFHILMMYQLASRASLPPEPHKWLEKTISHFLWMEIIGNFVEDGFDQQPEKISIFFLIFVSSH